MPMPPSPIIRSMRYLPARILPTPYTTLSVIGSGYGDNVEGCDGSSCDHGKCLVYLGDMRWVMAVIVCTGCSSILGIDDFKLTDAGNPGDSVQDGTAIDAPMNCL